MDLFSGKSPDMSFLTWGDNDDGDDDDGDDDDNDSEEADGWREVAGDALSGEIIKVEPDESKVISGFKSSRCIFENIV